MSIDYAQHQVAVAGQPVELTNTEYAVLYQLSVQAPNVLTHGLLLQRVWGPERVGEVWLLRDVVKKLRRKLWEDAQNPKYIVTEPRVGYRMATEGTCAVRPQSEQAGLRSTRSSLDSGSCVQCPTALAGRGNPRNSITCFPTSNLSPIPGPAQPH